MPRFIVDVTVEWKFEIEAEDVDEAEVIARDMAEGDHYWTHEPDYFDAWAEEVV